MKLLSLETILFANLLPRKSITDLFFILNMNWTILYSRWWLMLWKFYLLWLFSDSSLRYSLLSEPVFQILCRLNSIEKLLDVIQENKCRLCCRPCKRNLNLAIESNQTQKFCIQFFLFLSQNMGYKVGDNWFIFKTSLFAINNQCLIRWNWGTEWKCCYQFCTGINGLQWHSMANSEFHCR